MNYTELMIKIKSEDTEKATGIAEMLDIGGIYIEDYSDMLDCSLVQQFGLIDEELLNKDTEQAVLHIYFADNINITECIEFLRVRFAAENIPMTLLQNKIKEEDYANSWKQYYKPIKIGRNIVVVPEWESYTPSEGEKILKIDPGMAFGTGTHETTSLCIEALQDYLKQGDKLFDIGCGSGILSITGLILGADIADALDIDPNAVKIAKENAALNSFKGYFNAFSGNILNGDKQVLNKIDNKKYDIIIANIVADIIIRLSDFSRSYIKKGGYFITSGIITERADEVEKALISNGFVILEKRIKKGWVCFISKV
jgi:ribosomal protein L11 methyltransferase